MAPPQGSWVSGDRPGRGPGAWHRHGRTYVAVHSRRAVQHVLQLEDDGERGVTDHLRHSEAAPQNQSLVPSAATRTHGRGASGGGAPVPRTPPPPHPSPHGHHAGQPAPPRAVPLRSSPRRSELFPKRPRGVGRRGLYARLPGGSAHSPAAAAALGGASGSDREAQAVRAAGLTHWVCSQWAQLGKRERRHREGPCSTCGNNFISRGRLLTPPTPRGRDSGPG